MKGSPIGTLVPIAGTDGRTGEHYEHCAYLPAPLPPSVELSSATWTAVVYAEAALARLDQAARQMPEPGLLHNTTLRREAQSTSALEGTYAPIEEILGSDAEERMGLSTELREILNYVATAERAFAWIAERPLTLGLLESLQGLLVKGTPGEYRDAGRLRERQVFIGSERTPIARARFVPAPHGDRLRAGLEAWAAWIDGSHPAVPPVAQAALAHYQFESLHPFSDGNGRLGRLVIVLQLMRLGVLRYPLLVVSPWFEARRDQYQAELLALSRTGNWDAWVCFFVTGVGASATSTHERVDSMLALQAEMLREVRDAGVSGVAERLAGELIGSPVLRASQVRARHGVTHQGAMNALRRLAELGIVMEQPRRGGVSFIAPRVVALLSR